MQADFWLQRWQAGEIGFHRHEYNAHMTRFIDLLGIGPGDHILVPLCGKSLDMIWLCEQNFRVTGIEISPVAVDAFFAENNIEHDISEYEWGLMYQSDSINILCADFFNIHSADLPHIDAVYDRASLIALPQDIRPDYVTQLARLIPDTARSLLITLDYPQQEMNGPPFSVGEADVKQLFGQQFIVESIIAEDCLANEPRFQAKGLSRLDERVFLLIKNIP
ncbi:MAG: thiopurine S-methyltransferase [Gammaproteobacteria bacterium]|nr:thiopurine S-methyltransferase [Gammaproteobacteria bacterium]